MNYKTFTLNCSSGHRIALTRFPDVGRTVYLSCSVGIGTPMLTFAEAVRLAKALTRFARKGGTRRRGK